jgi:hypothetical protein
MSQLRLTTRSSHWDHETAFFGLAKLRHARNRWGGFEFRKNRASLAPALPRTPDQAQFGATIPMHVLRKKWCCVKKI